MKKNNKKNTNVINITDSFLEKDYDIEEVPYLNNESDEVQDVLKEVQKHTKDIENKILKKATNNILNVNFKK